MGCNCDQRRLSLQRAGSAVAGGRIGVAAVEVRKTVRSFVQDARSAQSRREMLLRLTKTRQR
jgi:hypothetical protein